jgi:RNAse (barnase) inhibitor barstar
VKRLSDLLKNSETSGVYLLEESASVQDLEKSCKEQGLAVFHLEGRDIHNKAQFLKQAALVLRFPDYFGNNWDAFSDCLADMSWHEADGFVILYDHFEPLAKHAPQEFEMLLDLLKESTEFWRDQGKAVFVLLHGESMERSDLPQVHL